MSYLRDRIRQLEQTVEWLEVRLRRLEDGGADPIYVQPRIPPWRLTNAELRAVMTEAVWQWGQRSPSPSYGSWSQFQVDACRRAAEEAAP